MVRRSVLSSLLLIMAIGLFAAPLAPVQAACITTVPAGDTAALIAILTCVNASLDNETITLGGGTYILSAVHSSDTGLPPIPSTSTGGRLTINGNGATIARSSTGGTPNFRLMQLNAGANVTLNTLRLTNGNLPGSIGGAILNQSSTLKLEGMTVDLNNALSGAGIFNSGGTVILHESLIAGNTAASFGGGLANASGTLHVINSTISGNQANGTASFHGGGAIDSYGTNPVMSFYNSTVAFNTAAAPNAHKSGIWMEAGSGGFYNSIFANNNGANNCHFPSPATWSYFGNIDNGTSCAFTVGMYNNTDPQLFPLAANGGPTRTHALRPGSPAINNGADGYAVEEDDTTQLTTDQRGPGSPRIRGASVDIGAFETVCYATPYVIPAGDTTSLIDAINCANATVSDDTIDLSTSTYNLTAVHSNDTGLPPIASTSTGGRLTINGNLSIIQRSTAGGTPNFRLFNVLSGGNLTLNQMTIQGGNVGGLTGGAIFSAGALTLNRVTVRASQAGGGGGLFMSGGPGVIRDSIVEGNTTTSYGGGIAHSGGTLHVINSTISGNQANGTGGSSGGGAIDSYNNPTLFIMHSTIAFNTAVSPNAAKSGIWLENGTLTIQSSIVSNNNGTNNCVISGTLTDSTGNIDDGASCGFGASSLSSTNPRLLALAINGGSTRTHAFDTNSPARDYANFLPVDQNGQPLLTDQRGAGFPRSAVGVADSGAYEFQCNFVYPYTVAASDVTNLIRAMHCANATISNETITLTNSTYTLTTTQASELGLPVITTAVGSGTLTINGNGATLTRSTAGGTPDFKFFELQAGAVLSLNHLTLTNGRAQVGGAIYNSGALTLTAVTISGSQAISGGAISNAGGTLVIRDSTLHTNTATQVAGALENSGGTVTIINSTISGNQVTGGSPGSGGGAINNYNFGPLRIINSTIAFNTAPRIQRSGIWHENGTLTIQNSIVSNNNGANNCVIDGGTLTDNGGNIDNGASCGFGSSSLSNSDPQLTALDSYGGPTQTHYIALTSPAVNFGINVLAVDENGAGLANDQRGTGFTRRIGLRVDSGALELNNALLTITLTLQGRGAPPTAAHVVPTTVQFRSSPGGALLFTRSQDSTTSGTVSMSEFFPATYNLRIKTPTTLAVVHTITVAPGVNTLTTAVLREGDANNDNVVNITDFSILAASFGRAEGQLGYDARADFNGDNVVTVADFSLLAASFGQVGAA